MESARTNPHEPDLCVLMLDAELPRSGDSCFADGKRSGPDVDGNDFAEMVWLDPGADLSFVDLIASARRLFSRELRGRQGHLLLVQCWERFALERPSSEWYHRVPPPLPRFGPLGVGVL